MKKMMLPISAMLLISSGMAAAQNAAATQAHTANPIQPGRIPAQTAAATAPANTAPATATQTAAQPQSTAQPQTATPAPGFTQEQLDTALAPVALYPDSLLAQLLMAATYPDQVLEAAKWSKEHPKMKGEEAVKAVQNRHWDPSVSSLVAFPQVLEMLSGKPEWVKELGEMFLADPDAVMNTIQGLRRKAKEAGNLKSTKEQKVVVKEASPSSSTSTSSSTGGNTIIEIQPTNPEVVYVPAYNPTVVYGSWWHPTPPYYYQPPYYNPVAAIIGFGAAVAIGHALWSHWDWHHHDININVNRYNNINVNKRLDIHNKRASWRQNIRERNPRYSQITRDRARDRLNNRFGDRTTRPALNDRRQQAKDRLNNRIGDRSTRPALNDRSRDLQRERARQQLQNKGGINLDRARQSLQRNPERVNKALERANKMSPAQRQQLRDRVGERRPAAGNIKRPTTRDIKRPSGATTPTRPTTRRKSTRPTTTRNVTKRPSAGTRRSRSSASQMRPANLNRQMRQSRSRPARRSGGGRRQR